MRDLLSAEPAYSAQGRRSPPQSSRSQSPLSEASPGHHFSFSSIRCVQGLAFGSSLRANRDRRVKLRKKYLGVGSCVLWIGKSFPNLSFIVLRPHNEYAPAG